MSDVVATILLLALTVTLFAAIFFFVTTFPTPPPQPSNQFSATLTYGGVQGKNITKVSILHLAGPTLSGAISFYIQSTAHPTKVTGNPFTLAQGLAGATTWGLGQTWSLSLTTYGLKVPDNISVAIVSPTQVLLRVSLPGANPNIPPTFENVGTTPTTPAIGQSFQVFAQIVDDDLNFHSVYVNYSQLPGSSGVGHAQMVFLKSTGLWVYNFTSGFASAAGTYYVFVNATDNVSQVNSVAIPITIVSPTKTSLLTVSLLPTPTAMPVVGGSTTVTAFVTNNQGGTLAVTVAFAAGGGSLGTSAGSIGGGATVGFSKAWVPAAVGPVLLSATATITGGGSNAATLNLTVFPKILFIAHDQAAGTVATNNTSGYFVQELVADGIPFTQEFVACNAALPAAATLDTYGLVIVDFGSQSGGVCAASPSTTEQAKLVGTNFIIAGADLFHATACSSYGATFLTDFGVTSGVTCTTAVTSATATLTYTSTPASGLQAYGVPTLTLNKTLAGSNLFVPYSYFTNGATHQFLKDGSAHILGSWNTASSKTYVALATDPSLLTSALPSGSAWGTGGPGASVVYNLVGFTSGIASSSSAGRALYDFGLAGTVVVGQSHTKATVVYAAIRENGPTGTTITATLYVNGSVAVYQGLAVTNQTTLSSAGGWAYVGLYWEAPGGGKYTLSVVLTAPGGQLDNLDTQMPVSILNQPVTFA
ncbi:MAG TPA: type IV pilin [Thermoplasmata archaeon]|nr:type IV pilin [Thermoplasmata archaeon]